MYLIQYVSLHCAVPHNTVAQWLRCEAPSHYSLPIGVRPTWSPCDHILISPSANVNASQVAPTTHQYVVAEDNFWHRITWSNHDHIVISPLPHSYLPNPLCYFKFITLRLWPTLPRNTDQHWGQSGKVIVLWTVKRSMWPPCEGHERQLYDQNIFPPRSSVDRCYDYLAIIGDQEISWGEAGGRIQSSRWWHYHLSMGHAL